MEANSRVSTGHHLQHCSPSCPCLMRGLPSVSVQAEAVLALLQWSTVERHSQSCEGRGGAEEFS